MNRCPSPFSGKITSSVALSPLLMGNIEGTSYIFERKVALDTRKTQWHEKGSSCKESWKHYLAK